MFKPFLLFFAIVAVVLIPLSLAPAQQSGAAAKAIVSAHVKVTAESQARARKIYQMDCALCHNENGDGQTEIAKDSQYKLSDWSKPEALAAKSDDQLFAFIRNGHGNMPSEEAGRARDEDVWNLIVYIRRLAGADQGAAGGSAAKTPADPR